MQYTRPGTCILLKGNSKQKDNFVVCRVILIFRHLVGQWFFRQNLCVLCWCLVFIWLYSYFFLFIFFFKKLSCFTLGKSPLWFLAFERYNAMHVASGGRRACPPPPIFSRCKFFWIIPPPPSLSKSVHPPYLSRCTWMHNPKNVHYSEILGIKRKTVFLQYWFSKS